MRLAFSAASCIAALSMSLSACQGRPGLAGGDGRDGVDGRDGSHGNDGQPGQEGADGTACWDLDGDGQPDEDEDANGDATVDVLDCRGAVGATGGTGDTGPAGDAGAQGLPGTACWDLDNDGQPDADEDTNGDATVDVLDCRGAVGATGAAGAAGAPGASCWDLDGDDQPDADEDVNGDATVDVLDCRGATGATGVPGASCWDLDGDGQPDADEDVNGDATVDVGDCRGTVGAAGPKGDTGPAGDSGPQGLPGTACWDLDDDGQPDEDEDINDDGNVDALDCQGPAGPTGEAGLPGESCTLIDNQDGTASIECPNAVAVEVATIAAYSALEARTAALEDVALSCGDGMVQFGALCLEASERAALGWGPASATCRDAGRRLCRLDELIAVCDPSAPPTLFNMQDDEEWTSTVVDLPVEGGFADVATLFGSAPSCNKGGLQSTSGSLPYRCCADILTP